MITLEKVLNIISQLTDDPINTYIARHEYGFLKTVRTIISLLKKFRIDKLNRDFSLKAVSRKDSHSVPTEPSAVHNCFSSFSVCSLLY